MKQTPILNPELSIKESPAFYRIVAHMIGDGSASGNHVPYYANTCKQLREQFKTDLNIFGEVKIYERKPNTTPIVYFPKVITDILSHILKIRFSYPDHIPKQIFNASDECKSAFLRALFDDEGTISTNLAISMSNFNLIKELRILVGSLGIGTNNILIKKNKSYKDNFYLSIKRNYFKEFKEKIGFDHPEKMRNLEFAIVTRNREQRTRNSKQIEKQVIEYLKDNSMKTLDLANKLQFSLNYTLNFLKIMEKERKIKRSGFKNKIIWSLT